MSDRMWGKNHDNVVLMFSKSHPDLDVRETLEVRPGRYLGDQEAHHIVTINTKNDVRYVVDTYNMSPGHLEVALNEQVKRINERERKLLLNKEYSEKFDEIRKNLVAVSFHKYGPASRNFTPDYRDGKPNVDAIGCIRKCLTAFEATGNTEYLADAANYCMFRYMFPCKGESFHYTDSNGSAGIVGLSVKELEAYNGN